MGKVQMSGIVPQLVAPSKPIPENFADATWEQIIEVCQTGAVPDTWEVGDQKAMTINGTDYAIDIIGKNHDTYSDGSGTAPLTFQMHDCYGTKYTMSKWSDNTGGWKECDMRNTHLSTILSLMPSEVQAGIKEVNKKSGAGQGTTTINTTADKLFLLSEIEIFGSVTYSVAGEGSQYAYYSAGNSKIKNLNGSAQNWWLRSWYLTTAFSCVYSDGSNGHADAANNAMGVAPAFCF